MEVTLVFEELPNRNTHLRYDALIAYKAGSTFLRTFGDGAGRYSAPVEFTLR